MRKRVAVPLVLLAFAVAWWLIAPPLPPSEDEGAVASLGPESIVERKARALDLFAPGSESEREMLRQYLQVAEIVSVVLDTAYKQPGGFMSMSKPDDLLALAPPELPEPFAGSEAAENLMSDGFSTTKHVDEATLAALYEAGFGPDGAAWQSDPWAAVLDLEVLRQGQILARAEHDRASWRRANERAAALKERGAASKDAVLMEVVEGLMENESYAPDLAVVESRVGDVLARWPDHPAADHARAYGVIAAQSGGTYDAARAKALVDQLLAGDNPEITALALEFAAHVPSAPNGVRYTDEDYDRLAAWADAHPEHPLPHDLADHCSERAMNRPDAEAWLRRREAAVAELCKRDRFSCESTMPEGVRRRAYLDAQRGAPPATWQAALMATVRACDREHKLGELAVAAAVWKDGWTWLDTHPPGPFLDCVTQAAMPTPHPEPGQLLLLEAAPPGVMLPGPLLPDMLQEDAPSAPAPGGPGDAGR